jgi:hypothetical protein
VRQALLVLFVGVLLVGAGAVVALAATGGGPTGTDEQAAANAKLVEEGIADERAAIKAIDHHRVLTALNKAKAGKLGIDLPTTQLAGHDWGAGSDDAYKTGEDANALDKDVISDLEEATTAKGKEQTKLLADARKKLLKAIDLKKKVLLFFTTYTAPPTTTTTVPAPSVGPLTVCIFITNNGSTSTENVHIRDPGADGMPGTVTFNGPGIVDQRATFTIPAGGSLILPTVVSSFGSSTVDVTVGSQVASTSFDLNSSTDVTKSDCP